MTPEIFFDVGIPILLVTLILALTLLVSKFLNFYSTIRHSVLLTALFFCISFPATVYLFQSHDWQFWTVEIPKVEPVPTKTWGDALTEERGLEAFHLEVPVEAFLSPSLKSSPPMEMAQPTLPSIQLWQVLILVWGGVTAFYLLRLHLSWQKLKSLPAEKYQLSSSQSDLLKKEAHRLFQLTSLPEIYSSHQVPAPIAVGFIKPRIYLPRGIEAVLSRDQFMDVLIHELAHIKRKDQWVVIFQRIVGIIFWPHPLVHSINRQIENAREDICDNYVLMRSEASSYSRTLLTLTEWVSKGNYNSLALGLFPKKRKLEQRVARLLDQRRKRMTRTRMATIVSIFSIFSLLVLVIAGTQVQAQSKSIEDELEGVKTKEDKKETKDEKKTVKKKEKKKKTVNPIDEYVYKRLQEEKALKDDYKAAKTALDELLKNQKALKNKTAEQAAKEKLEKLSDAERKKIEDWVKNGITSDYDKWVQSELGYKEKIDWINRLHLDLTGLPFKESPKDFCPQEQKKKFAYRDWVIKALNEGVPFDHFALKDFDNDGLKDLYLTNNSACLSCHVAHDSKTIEDYYQFTKIFHNETPSKWGAKFSKVSRVLRSQLNLATGQGIMVDSLVKNGKAQKAGLKKFDIILSVNDKKVYSEEDFNEVLKWPASQEVKIRIIRSGKRTQVTMKTNPYNWQELTRSIESKTPYYIGVRLDPVQKVVVSQLGLKERNYLFVSAVFPESPAKEAGVKQYDILLKVNDKPLENVAQLQAILKLGKGKPIAIKILRNGESMTLSVKPEEISKRKAEAKALEELNSILDFHVRFR